MIHAYVDSPIGPLLLIGDGSTVSALFTARHRRFAEQSDDDRSRTSEVAFGQARQELAEYFEGSRQFFDVPVAPTGTPFQRRVWSELREIPYSTTATYSEIAARIGLPGAARAVGAANAKNPVSIIVPCHRVVGSNGSLTGYAGGIEAKRWLLDHERARGDVSRCFAALPPPR
jgi:methylated-DNA-[protein]-cysteine S-methyltransferase